MFGTEKAKFTSRTFAIHSPPFPGKEGATLCLGSSNSTKACKLCYKHNHRGCLGFGWEPQRPPILTALLSETAASVFFIIPSVTPPAETLLMYFLCLFATTKNQAVLVPLEQILQNKLCQVFSFTSLYFASTQIWALAFLVPFDHPTPLASLLPAVSKRAQIVALSLWIYPLLLQNAVPNQGSGTLFLSCILSYPLLAPLLYFEHVNSSGALGGNKHSFNFEIANNPADFN